MGGDETPLEYLKQRQAVGSLRYSPLREVRNGVLVAKRRPTAAEITSKLLEGISSGGQFKLILSASHRNVARVSHARDSMSSPTSPAYFSRQRRSTSGKNARTTGLNSHGLVGGGGSRVFLGVLE